MRRPLTRLRTRLLATVVRRLPPALIRWIGRRQFAGPASRAVITRASGGLRTAELTIAHGAAAGLRINAGGAHPGYALGTSEPLVQDALERHVHSGDVVYDIGANIGFFTIITARLVGPAGHVYAYEPLRENVVALERNIALNDFRNVTVRPCAVSRHDGSALLEVAPEPNWAQLESVGTRPDVQGRVRVDTVALDSELARGARPPSIVKIDVEGAELEVLDGMLETLRRHRPVVLAEMHGRNREVAERLRGAGYALSILEGKDPVEDAEWWVHVLALPERIELDPTRA